MTIGDARLPQCQICGVTPVVEVVWKDGGVFLLCETDRPSKESGEVAEYRELDYAERHGMTEGDV